MQRFRDKHHQDMPDVSLFDTLKMRALPVEAAAVNLSSPEVTTVRLNALPRSKRPGIIDVLCLLLTVLGTGLWVCALRPIAFSQLNDLGLISALSPEMIASFALLVLSFVLTLQRKEMRETLLLVEMVCLIFVLYGTPSLVEEVPHFPVVYRLAGDAEYIMRTGTVNPFIDLYFDWTGFFNLSAFLTKIFGYSTILTYAGWAPIFYNVIYIGPMYMIFTSATSNKRLVWLSLLFFCLTNWVGQDYFSPQGLNFFLYLVLIAVLLKWFCLPGKMQATLPRSASLFQRVLAWLRVRDPQPPTLEPWKRRGLLCCMVAICAFIVCSHPLTPFFVILSTSLLVICRRCSPFWLPLLMTAMTAVWLLTVASPYTFQHVNLLIGTLGDLTGNVPKSITTGNLQESPLYQIIARTRLYTTLALWGCALLGALKRWFQGHHDLTLMLLAISGFPLIAAQSYGGEILMRIYLFSEPFMVFFMAALFCENSRPRYGVRAQRRARTRKPARATALWRTALLALVSLVLLASFFFTRYGDERVDYVTRGEWHAVQYLYATAPAGATVIEGWNDAPVEFEDFGKYDLQSLAVVVQGAVLHTDAHAVVEYILHNGHPATYLIFSREEQAHASAWDGLPTSALPRMEAALLQTGLFKVVYLNSDAQILQFQHVARSSASNYRSSLNCCRMRGIR